MRRFVQSDPAGDYEIFSGNMIHRDIQFGTGIASTNCFSFGKLEILTRSFKR